MNYRLRTRGVWGNYKRKLITASIGLIAALFFFGGSIQRFLAPPFHFVFDRVLSSSFKMLNSSKTIFSYLKPKYDLITENENLRLELFKAKSSLFNYEVLKNDNSALRKITEKRGVEKSVLAGVLRLPDQSPYDTVLIDAGADFGISSGNKVYGSPDIPIGEVKYVYANSSLVKLFSSPGETYDVFIGPHKVSGKATGRGGGNFEVILPHGVEVSVGDIVVLPGINSTPFGIVLLKEETVGKTFIKALFKNPFSFDELRFVEVVIK